MKRTCVTYDPKTKSPVPIWTGSPRIGAVLVTGDCDIADPMGRRKVFFVVNGLFLKFEFCFL